MNVCVGGGERKRKTWQKGQEAAFMTADSAWRLQPQVTANIWICRWSSVWFYAPAVKQIPRKWKLLRNESLSFHQFSSPGETRRSDWFVVTWLAPPTSSCRIRPSVYIELQPRPAGASPLCCPLLQEESSNQLCREDAGKTGKKPGEEK